jgi:hypothetical protein
VNVYWLRKFWFGPTYYSDTVNHPHYHTVRFANQPNIDAQIWLTIFSPGIRFEGGGPTAAGSAAAGIKGYAFVNAEERMEEKILDTWESSVRIERAVDITFAFHVRLAWAKADGMIYYWN